MRNRQRVAHGQQAGTACTPWADRRHPIARTCAAAAPVVLLLASSHPLAILVASLYAWCDQRGGPSKRASTLSAWILLPIGLYFLIQITLGGRGHTVLDIPLTGGMISLEAIVFAAANGLRWLLLVVLSFRLASLLDAETWLRILSGRWAPLGTAIGLCLRFIPWLAKDAFHAYAIQRNRTIETDDKAPWSHRGSTQTDKLRLGIVSIRRQLRPVQAALLTLVDTTMERSNGFAETLSLRGYGSSQQPGRLPGRRWRSFDTLLVLCSLFGTGGLLYSAKGYSYFPVLSPILPSGYDLMACTISAVLICGPVSRWPMWQHIRLLRLVFTRRPYDQEVQP